MDTESQHPALLYCQKLWPTLDWKHESSEESHLIWAETPLNLQISLEIRGEIGSFAEIRSNKRYMNGCIFKQSRNNLGVSWKDAIDELISSLAELSQSINPQHSTSPAGMGLTYWRKSNDTCDS